jgi:hypothetical protein
MTRFRLDVSRQTGTAILWMVADTPCGFKPVLGWPSIDGVREFAEMLLDVYHQSQTGKENAGEEVCRNLSLN